MVKNIYQNQRTKRNRCRKNGGKDEKALHTFMNNVVYRKIMENLRNKIDVNL